MFPDAAYPSTHAEAAAIPGLLWRPAEQSGSGQHPAEFAGCANRWHTHPCLLSVGREGTGVQPARRSSCKNHEVYNIWILKTLHC